MLFTTKKSSELSSQIQTKSKYDKAQFIASGAWDLFKACLDRLDQANEILKEDLDEKITEIDILHIQLENSNLKKEKTIKAIEENKNFREKIIELIF